MEPIEPAQSQAVRRFQIGLLTLAGALILFGAVFGAQTMIRLRGSIDWVTHTLAIQKVIEESRAASHDVDAYGLRYLLAQQEEHQQQHQRAIIRVNLQLQRLREMFGDNQDQIKRLDQVTNVHRRRNAWFQRAMGRAEDFGVNVATARVRQGGDAALSQEIRLELDRMEMVSKGLLSERQKELNDALTQGSVTILLLNSLALIMAGVALVLLRRGTRELQSRREVEVRALEAERAAREKSEFLASMSHEIRTPMNAVLGFSQLLSRTRIEPKAREYLKAIRTSGEALLSLINDILDLSKIEAGKLNLAPQSLEVRELVDSTAGVFSEAAHAKSLTLRTRVAPDVPRTMTIDPHRFRQALLNLLSNAVKYNKEGEVLIEVNATPVAPGRADFRFRIRDTGRGIAPEQMDQLFEPFHRAVGEQDVESGTGLGLAIVRRLVSLMGGEVSAESSLGKGSIFTLSLPNVEVDQQPAHRRSDAGDAISFANIRKSRILIADDVAWNRDLLSAFLAEGDHDLAFAIDGQQALQKVADFSPDLILMDLRMPTLDGRAATQRLREQLGEAAPTVIAISASSMSRDERDVGDLFDGYIRKPVSREVLFQALAEHLGTVEQAGDNAHQVAPNPAAAAADNRHAQLSAAGLAELKRLRADSVPRLQSTLRTTEIRAFAEELITLGGDEQQPQLAYYGERLLAAVERFDVNMMESLIGQADEHLEAVLNERPPSDR